MLAQANRSKVSRIFFLSLSFILTLIAQLFPALPAQAECVAQGKTYQTGNTLGPYVCRPDGTWLPR